MLGRNCPSRNKQVAVLVIMMLLLIMMMNLIMVNLIMMMMMMMMMKMMMVMMMMMTKMMDLFAKAQYLRESRTQPTVELGEVGYIYK